MSMNIKNIPALPSTLTALLSTASFAAPLANFDAARGQIN
jgi:hypothetical protein